MCEKGFAWDLDVANRGTIFFVSLVITNVWFKQTTACNSISQCNSNLLNGGKVNEYRVDFDNVLITL